MNKKEANFMVRAQKRLAQIITDKFPEVPFDKSHPPEKFVGLIKISGQKTIALFIRSQQPICYEAIVIDR